MRLDPSVLQRVLCRSSRHRLPHESHLRLVGSANMLRGRLKGVDQTLASSLLHSQGPNSGRHFGYSLSILGTRYSILLHGCDASCLYTSFSRSDTCLIICSFSRPLMHSRRNCCSNRSIWFSSKLVQQMQATCILDRRQNGCGSTTLAIMEFLL